MSSTTQTPTPITGAAAKNERAPLLPQHKLHRTPIRFPSSSTTQPPRRTIDLYHPSDDSEDADHTPTPPPGWPVNRQGIPKLSRECLVSEIQCYGKYIVAVLLVFGLGGVWLALKISNHRRV